MITLVEARPQKTGMTNTATRAVTRPHLYRLGQLMFLDKFIEYTVQVRFSYFLQVIIDPGIWFFDIDQAVQIDGSSDDNRITIGIVNGGLQVF